jgi:uncharacterized caspase-like protein
LRAIFLALGLLTASAFPSAAQPQARLALVIGNADYNDNGVLETSEVDAAIAVEDGFAPDLNNPINDAAMIRDTLAELGYSVDFHTNLDRTELIAAIAAFQRRVTAAPRDGKVIIYYAGHAYDYTGSLFLVPANARVPAGRIGYGELLEFAVPLQDVRRDLRPASGRGFSLLVMDACRIEPGANPGLSPLGLLFGDQADRNQPARTLTIYSTYLGFEAPDGALQNSPFAIAMEARLRSTELSVSAMLSAVQEDMRAAAPNGRHPQIGGDEISDTCAAECAPGFPTPPAQERTHRRRR